MNKSQGSIMTSGLVIYSTKYGSTREYAESIASGLSVPLQRVGKIRTKEVASKDFLVIGSPIYGFGILPDMGKFLEDYRGLIDRKIMAAFVVCGDTSWVPNTEEGGWKNLEKLTHFFPRKPIATAILGGRMRLEELNPEDRSLILAFYERLGRKPTDFDRMDFSAVKPFIDRIQEVLLKK